MAGFTKTSTIALVLCWLAVIANAFHWLGNQLPLSQLVIALSGLIVGSLLVGLVWILRGPGYYRALRVGEAIGEQRERLRHRCDKKAASSRVGVTAG